MKRSVYVRRALAELPGMSSVPRNLKPGRLVLVSGAIAILTLLILIALTFAANTQKENCAFRIADQPVPETPGDAVQLDTCVTLERAVTPSARTLGLAHRPSMPRERGMLLDFEVPGEYCAWMKDMQFSLDIVWLNEGGEILLIKKDVSPNTYPTAFCGPADTRYILEVNAGVIAAGDLRAGQRINL